MTGQRWDTITSVADVTRTLQTYIPYVSLLRTCATTYDGDARKQGDSERAKTRKVVDGAMDSR